MFSGIIEAFGQVKKIEQGKESCALTLASDLVKELKRGSSIAVNGVCLTVVSLKNNSFTVDVMPETINKTNIGKLVIGNKVNLERPLAADGRFEGHIVQGHVDGVGTIKEKREVENAHEIRISAHSKILDLCVEKGSITIDGISLTLVDVEKDNFSVSIIPYTSQITTLGFKSVGDDVNLEVDILGKYIAKFMAKLAT
jgi:riboflavin synthase